MDSFVDIQPTNGRTIYYGTASPTAAQGLTFQVGDVIMQSGVAATRNVPIGWRCVVGGDPGTWVQFGVIQYAEVSVTAAQLAALRATPITMVAAPGAGYMNQFLHAQLYLDYTAPGFTETADNVAFKYVDGSGTAVSETVECTGFIDQTADTATSARAKLDVIAAKAACENVAIVLHQTGDGEWGGSGGSALRVKVAYITHATGW